MKGVSVAHINLSLEFSQRFGRQREVHDSEERPDGKVERSHEDVAEKDPVRVRVRSQVRDYPVPLPMQQSHHGDGGEKREGNVLEHGGVNISTDNSFCTAAYL